MKGEDKHLKIKSRPKGDRLVVRERYKETHGGQTKLIPEINKTLRLYSMSDKM